MNGLITLMAFTGIVLFPALGGPTHDVVPDTSFLLLCLIYVIFGIRWMHGVESKPEPVPCVIALVQGAGITFPGYVAVPEPGTCSGEPIEVSPGLVACTLHKRRWPQAVYEANRLIVDPTYWTRAS